MKKSFLISVLIILTLLVVNAMPGDKNIYIDDDIGSAQIENVDVELNVKFEEPVFSIDKVYKSDQLKYPFLVIDSYTDNLNFEYEVNISVDLNNNYYNSCPDQNYEVYGNWQNKNEHEINAFKTNINALLIEGLYRLDIGEPYC